jgi:hypothetical protein
MEAAQRTWWMTEAHHKAKYVQLLRAKHEAQAKHEVGHYMIQALEGK